MTHKKVSLSIGAVVVLILVSSTLTLHSNKSTSHIARIIDGDTFVLSNGERVRLLGINAPEKGQFYWKEAKNYLSEKTLNKNVVLERDKENRDKYGRLLRYVFVGNENVNLELIKKGYAKALIIEPNTKYSNLFIEAESEAREKNLGVWNITGIKDVFCIGIYYFHYNAKGNDNQYLNDEFVEFRNSCNYPVNLTGWKLSDNSGKTYIFPPFIAENKSIFVLHTGHGKNNKTDLYWSQDKAVWNNNGDSLKMWNYNDNLILEYSY